MENENKWEYDYSALYHGQNGQTPPNAQSAQSAQNPQGIAEGAANTQGTANAAEQRAPQQAAPVQDTGYVNVGSSGTGAANRYESMNTGAAAPNPGAGSYSAPNFNSANAGYAAPGCTAPNYTAPGAGYNAASGQTPPPPAGRRAHNKGSGVRIAKGALSLVLAGAVGFGGGFLGGRLSGGSGTKVVVQSVERDTSAVSGISTSTGGSNLSLTEVSALVSPSVVVITTEAMVSTGGWYGQSYVQSGAGSGVIMSEDGYILTCAHVIDGASNIVVTIGDKDYTATVIGEDTESDIAVIKIDASGLTPAVMGDSDALSVGEEVVAVGNPLGELGGTVTNGIISALNRDVVVEKNNMTLIQTNASVSPGNSGGGLFNMAGELIGIVNAKSSDSDAEGLGFAIPSNTAYQIAQQLIETGYVSGRPALGVTVLDVQDASTAAQYGVSAYGVYIYSVTSGSGADAAGLKSGDRIISIDSTEVATTADLTSAIGGHAVGDKVMLNVARSGQVITMEVTLGDKNAAANASAASESSAMPEQPADSGASGGNGRQGGFPGAQ